MKNQTVLAILLASCGLLGGCWGGDAVFGPETPPMLPGSLVSSRPSDSALPTLSYPSTARPEIDDPTRLDQPAGPVLAETQVAWAQTLERAGNLERADEVYRQALLDHPENLLPLVAYARMCSRHQRLDDAIELYRQAVQDHPQAALAWNDLGQAHAQRKEWGLAASAAARAIEIEPRNPLYASNLARILVAKGEPQGAMAALEQVYDPAIANYNLGVLLNKNGQSEAALARFHRAAELNPNLSQARTMVARLQSQARGGTPRQARRLPLPD